MKNVHLRLGDCLEVLLTLKTSSVDAVVTDPPASISFMGEAWDSDRGGRKQWTEWLSGIMAECFRCLKSSHYVLVWTIPRRSHWTAIAVEDAGFYIVDSIAHVFGSGFPKGKGQLKPAREDWLLCRKPGKKVLPLQIDSCRIPTSETWSYNADKNGTTFHGQQGERAKYSAEKKGADTVDSNPLGRWPANLIHDGSEEVVGMFPSLRGYGPAKRSKRERRQVFRPGVYSDLAQDSFGDSGSAARFFYTVKASRSEREKDNSHPTVKPLALMRYLIRLVTPRGGVVLDPFLGSGTTAIACMKERFDCIGIEKEPKYFEIAKRRCEKQNRKLALLKCNLIT